MLHINDLFPSSLSVMSYLIIVCLFLFYSHSLIHLPFTPHDMIPAPLTETCLCLAPLKSTHNWLFPATLYRCRVENVPVTL